MKDIGGWKKKEIQPERKKRESRRLISRNEVRRAKCLTPVDQCWKRVNYLSGELMRGGVERQSCAGLVVRRWLTVCDTHTHNTNTQTISYIISSLPSSISSLLTSFCHSFFSSSDEVMRPFTTPGVVLPTNTPGQTLVCYYWKPLTFKAEGWNDTYDIHKIWAPFTSSFTWSKCILSDLQPSLQDSEWSFVQMVT